MTRTFKFMSASSRWHTVTPNGKQSQGVDQNETRLLHACHSPSLLHVPRSVWFYTRHILPKIQPLSYTPVTLHVYIFLVHCNNMPEDGGRAGRSAKTAPNADYLKSSKKKYPSFNVEANTEYTRLDDIHKKKPLVTSSREYATYVHLCTMKEG